MTSLRCKRLGLLKEKLLHSIALQGVGNIETWRIKDDDFDTLKIVLSLTEGQAC